MCRTLIAAVAFAAAHLAAAAGTAPTSPKRPLSNQESAMLKMVHGKLKVLMEQCRKTPNAWQPRYEIGKLLLEFGRLKRAAEELDRAIALKPDHQPSYALSGRAHGLLKDYDMADKLLRKAIELDPKDKTSVQWRMRINMMRKEDQQLAKLNERLKQAPNDFGARLERGRLRMQQGKWREALADLQVLIDGVPHASGEALNLAATAHYRLGNLGEAVRLYERAAKAEPKNMQYRKNLAQAQQMYQVSAQLAQITKGLRSAPDDGQLHHQAGVLYSRVQQWPRAAAHLQKAAALLPQDAETHKAYAIALFRLGKMDDAEQELKTCVKLAPEKKAYAQLLATVKRLRSMHGAMRQMRGAKSGGRNPMAGMGMMMSKPHKTVPGAGTQPKTDSQK